MHFVQKYSPYLLIFIFITLAISSISVDAEANAASQELQHRESIVCSCDIQNELIFLRLTDTVREHQDRTEFRIDTTPICPSSCLVFDRQPDAPAMLQQGNWTIDRSGLITFVRLPHKTGIASMRITIQEASSISTYIANVTFRIDIIEEADWPIVFLSQSGDAVGLQNYSDAVAQWKNVSFTIEQNTGNNTAYSDLLFTAGAFDYDANEVISVHIKEGDAAARGLVEGLEVKASWRLKEPDDCDAVDAVRLAYRNLTEWDTALSEYQPCWLDTPYPSDELSWFSHIARYRPSIGQSGIDRFVLTYADKYRLESKILCHIYILQNPCVNEGRCRGPASDPNCTSTRRSLGYFDLGYLCQCNDGWVGDRCEIDFDDCASSPCPAPYVCKDKFRDFECVCPANLQNCAPLLHMWQVASIILCSLLLICFVVSVLILCNQRAPLVVKTAPEKQRLEDSQRSGDSTAAEEEHHEDVTPFADPEPQAVDMEVQTSFILEDEEQRNEEEAGFSFPQNADDTQAFVEEEEEVQSIYTESVHRIEARSVALSPMPQTEDFSVQCDLPKETESERNSRAEPTKEEAQRIAYRQSFSRSRSLFRPPILPRRALEIPEDEVPDSVDSDVELQSPRGPYPAADAQLLQIQRNRKVLTDF